MDREPLAAMPSVLGSLDAVHRILANGIADEPIILECDDRPDDDDDNLDTKHTRTSDVGNQIMMTSI